MAAEDDPEKANPFLQLPDEVLLLIVELSSPWIAGTCEKLWKLSEQFAEDEIRQQVNSLRTDENWEDRLSEYCLPPGVEATAPWRLVLHNANAVRSVPLSEHVFQPACGPVQVLPDGTLLMVVPASQDNPVALLIFDTTTGTIIRHQHLPGIRVIHYAGADRHLHTVNGSLIMHCFDTIFVWPSLHAPGNRHYTIPLNRHRAFQHVPAAQKSSVDVVTANGKLVVLFYDWCGTGGTVVCFDVATGRNHPPQDLHELLSIPTNTNGRNGSDFVYHQLVTFANRLFLLRYFGFRGRGRGRGQETKTGLFLLNFNEDGSLSVADFRPCFGVGRVIVQLGHHSGWSNSKWLVYFSNEVPGVKALPLMAGGIDGTNAVEHDIPFERERKQVLLVVGDRLIVQNQCEQGEVELDEVCIHTGKVLRTLALGCSRHEYKLSSVVATSKDELVCIMNKIDVEESVIKTFLL